MKLTSYWLDTSPPFDHGSSKPLEGRYDVAVVGGGLTGSSAALALAKKDARVAVLEAETIGNAVGERVLILNFRWPAQSKEGTPYSCTAPTEGLYLGIRQAAMIESTP